MHKGLCPQEAVAANTTLSLSYISGPEDTCFWAQEAVAIDTTTLGPTHRSQKVVVSNGPYVRNKQREWLQRPPLNHPLIQHENEVCAYAWVRRGT